MSDARQFQPGEIVDIAIKGALVLDVTGTHPPTIHFTVASGENVSWSMPLTHEQIAVERIAPPEWPPRPGDLWRDRDGILWFATDRANYDAESAERIVMVSPGEYQHGISDDVQLLNRFAGPLTLVHREPEGGAS